MNKQGENFTLLWQSVAKQAKPPSTLVNKKKEEKGKFFFHENVVKIKRG
jgi:hypothetical protein